MGLLAAAAIVCGIAVFALAYAFQRPSEGGVTITSLFPQVGQPPEQSTDGEGASGPTAWWSGEEAEAACGVLAGAFTSYQLTQAAAAPQLRCDYGSQALEGGMIAARIQIWGFDTVEAARQDWQAQFGPDSEFAKAWPELDGQGFSYTPEADRYFLTFSGGHAGKIAYRLQGGLLYQNAIVVFTEMETADPSAAGWQRVQELARQLVDQKNSK